MQTGSNDNPKPAVQASSKPAQSVDLDKNDNSQTTGELKNFLREANHPIVCLFTIGFKILSIVSYI